MIWCVYFHTEIFAHQKLCWCFSSQNVDPNAFFLCCCCCYQLCELIETIVLFDVLPSVTTQYINMETLLSVVIQAENNRIFLPLVFFSISMLLLVYDLRTIVFSFVSSVYWRSMHFNIPFFLFLFTSFILPFLITSKIGVNFTQFLPLRFIISCCNVLNSMWDISYTSCKYPIQ